MIAQAPIPSAPSDSRLRFARFRRVASILLLPVTLTAVALGTSRMQAQTTATLNIIYNRGSSTLALGLDGDLYGVYGSSDIFRLSTAGVLTTLASLDGGESSSALTRGDDGNFYGSTVGGGSGGGTVFQITQDGVFTTLYAFTDQGNAAPSAGVVQGSDGSLYGTTAGSFYNGLVGNDGSIFRLSPSGNLTTLHTYSEETPDVLANGAYPLAGLVQGSDGNFYGVTQMGGSSNDGVVFRVTPSGGYDTLYNFSGGEDGATPMAALVQGSNGDFYGVTVRGGTNGDGTVFRMTPDGVLTTLHGFAGTVDGGGPEAALVQGNDGNFYGTTSNGGADDYGTVFQITPAGALTTLYSFTGGSDGGSPVGLVQGTDGSFYGATLAGGADNVGTIFQLTVFQTPTKPAFFKGEVALSDGVYYLAFPNGDFFGYYSYLSQSAPYYIYHQDLGFEYVQDAGDGKAGVYFYDFASGTFFYTSPTFPFPYLYDFSLKTILYYYPDPDQKDRPGRYNTNGVRYFYRFDTGQIIVK